MKRMCGQRMLYWLALPAAIMLLAWQWEWPPLQPAPGFDESWTAGLAMAVHDGLVFGQQVVFTYGPLGFLTVGSLWHVHLAEASVAYTLLLRFAFALAAFAAARRTFGVLVAAPITLVVASVDVLLLEPTVFLVAAVWALTSDLGDSRAAWLSGAAGALAGLQLLDKVSVGVSLVALTGVFVLNTGRRRVCAAAATVGFVGSVLVLWTVMSQPVGALPDYVLNSASITLGYGAAVGIETPGLGWQYPAAFVALGLGLWAAWQMTARMRPRQRWGVVLLWLVFWFFAFKEGFVRHDPEHDVFFFGPVLGGFLAFRWRGGRRLISLAGIAALLALALEAQTTSLASHLDVTRNVSLAVDQVRDVLSPSRRALLISVGRAQIEATEPIDPQALKLLRGHTVDVWPSEIALAWAYRLDWDPLPVMQSYSAYTTRLDELDAAALASSHAPERILFIAGAAPDDRVVSFDEGLTSRAILCRYRMIYASGTIAVLARAANRCSPPTLIATVKARGGTASPRPASDSTTLAGLGRRPRCRGWRLGERRSVLLQAGRAFRVSRWRPATSTRSRHGNRRSSACGLPGGGFPGSVRDRGRRSDDRDTHGRLRSTPQRSDYLRLLCTARRATLTTCGTGGKALERGEAAQGKFFTTCAPAEVNSVYASLVELR